MSNIELVASGPERAKPTKGQTEGDLKYFEFPASNLKAEDYPAYPSTTVGKGADAKKVPQIKIAPVSILVRKYADKDAAIANAGSEEKFWEVVLDLVNAEERVATLGVVRKRVADAKELTLDPADFGKDAHLEVNIWDTEKRAGRVSQQVKMKEMFDEVKAKFGSDPEAAKLALAEKFAAAFGFSF